MGHTRVSEDQLGTCASALWRPELGCSATGDRRLGEPERSNSTRQFVSDLGRGPV